MIEELMKYPLTLQEFQLNMERRIYTKVVAERLDSMTIENESPAIVEKSIPKKSIFYPEEDNVKNDPPMMEEAKIIVKDNVLELIEKHRLAYMIRGQSFEPPINSRSKQLEKAIFCQLSKDRRYLHYIEVAKYMNKYNGANKEGTLETKSNIKIENILNIHTSNDEKCEIFETLDASGGLSNLQKIIKFTEFLICIDFDVTETKIPSDQCRIELVAKSKKEFDYFCDGLNILLNRKMESDQFMSDFKQLEDLEARMRFVQVNKGDDTKMLPKIPPPPSNYNFCKHHIENGNVIRVSSKTKI